MNDADHTSPYQPASVDEVATDLPQRIGRYRVEGTLGQGGFGVVYLAHDEQLHRAVAIKVPHRHLIAHRTPTPVPGRGPRLAGLDHPNIVPVYDVGGTDRVPCYVVSKLSTGPTSPTRIKQYRLFRPTRPELVTAVAEALHHAHTQEARPPGRQARRRPARHGRPGLPGRFRTEWP